MNQPTSFALLLLVAYLVPGPDFAVITDAATRNLRLGALTAAGVVCGLALHSTLAVLGLSAVIRETSWGLPVLRAVGALYLGWIGTVLVRESFRPAPQPLPRLDAPGPMTPPAAASAWSRGLLTNVLNPKTLLFYVALLPQFVDPGRPAAAQLLVLSAITVACGALWWSAVVRAAAHLTGWLEHPGRRRVLDRVTGAGLLALAAGMAVL